MVATLGVDATGPRGRPGVGFLRRVRRLEPARAVPGPVLGFPVPMRSGAYWLRLGFGFFVNCLAKPRRVELRVGSSLDCRPYLVNSVVRIVLSLAMEVANIDWSRFGTRRWHRPISCWCVNRLLVMME